MSDAPVAGIELRLNRSDFSHTSFGSKIDAESPRALADNVNIAVEKLRKQVLNHLGLGDIPLPPAAPASPSSLSLSELFRRQCSGEGWGTFDITAAHDRETWDTFWTHLAEMSGLLRIPVTTLFTADGETLQIPAVQLNNPDDFDIRYLHSPHFGCFVQVVSDLVTNEAMDLGGFILMASGRNIGTILGNNLVNGGNGISGSLLQRAPIAVTGDITTAKLAVLFHSVNAPYRESKGCRWLVNDRDIKVFKRLRDEHGDKIYENGHLMGKLAVEDTFVPTGTVVFGDFSQYFARIVTRIRFEIDDREENENLPPENRLYSFRSRISADGELTDPEAIKQLVKPA